MKPYSPSLCLLQTSSSASGPSPIPPTLAYNPPIPASGGAVSPLSPGGTRRLLGCRSHRQSNSFELGSGQQRQRHLRFLRTVHSAQARLAKDGASRSLDRPAPTDDLLQAHQTEVGIVS